MHRERQEGVQHVARQRHVERQALDQRVQQPQEGERERVVAERRLLHVERALQARVHVERGAQRAARGGLVDHAALLELRPDDAGGAGVLAAAGQELAEHGVHGDGERRGRQVHGHGDHADGGVVEDGAANARVADERRQQAEQLDEALLILLRQRALLPRQRVLQRQREHDEHLLAEERRVHLVQQLVDAERVVRVAARQARVVADHVAEQTRQRGELVEAVVAQLQQRDLDG